MIKIYFAPTPWSSSSQVLEDYRYQTPGNSGVWENIVATTNLEESEYIVIQDETSDKSLYDKFPPNKRLYFNREALSVCILNNHPIENYNRFSFWDGTGYLPTRWWYGSNWSSGGINLDYDKLVDLEMPEKTKNLSCILSNKTMNEGHNLRKKFTEQFLNSYHFDLFGSVSFANSNLPDNNKFNTLKNYKYCLGFDNQDFIKDFFGTPFTDSILSWTVPIFWCGTDLKRYFPEKSFIQIDIRKENEIERLIELLKNDDYESRIPALTEARNLILNKYNFWPTIKKVIDNE